MALFCDRRKGYTAQEVFRQSTRGIAKGANRTGTRKIGSLTEIRVSVFFLLLAAIYHIGCVPGQLVALLYCTISVPSGKIMSIKQIWVDADACPNVIKQILFRAADRVGVQTTLVANQPLQIPRWTPAGLHRSASLIARLLPTSLTGCLQGRLYQLANMPLVRWDIGIYRLGKIRVVHGYAGQFNTSEIGVGHVGPAQVGAAQDSAGQIGI